jgi:hypothetical protein
VRYEAIRSEPERREYRHRLWVLTVDETDIADLESFDSIEACGLDPTMVVDDDHGPCQTLSVELRESGYRGVLSPSAAIADIVNLTLFGSRRELIDRSDWDRNPRPDFFVPVSVAAEPAPPPPHVLGLARLYGDPHIGYERWIAAQG